MWHMREMQGVRWANESRRCVDESVCAIEGFTFLNTSNGKKSGGSGEREQY